MMKKAVSFVLALLLLTGRFPARAAEGCASCCDSQETHFSQRIPTSEVQKRLAGGTDYLDKYGVTREKVVKELSAHEYDDYYLNTPFVGGDWQSPRGDTSYNGAPGTNCAGFVAYVLRKCGLNVQAALKTMQSSSRFTRWGSGRPYDGLSSASNYMSLAEQGNLIAYAYESKKAMLADGKCEKGDVILRFWTDSWGGYDEDNHLMIFWGDTPSEDKVWQNASGRLHIGKMWDGNASTFIVIKFAPSVPAVPTVAGFRDVHETDWFASAVAYVKEAGLMNGTEVDTFEPKSPVLRGQVVTILWAVSGRPVAADPQAFSDVGKDQYYSTAVDWAVETGIAGGRGDGTFGPDENVSRQDLAVILYSYCRYRGGIVSSRADLTSYKDAGQVSDYAAEAMSWANACGLINGTDPDTLSPDTGADRGQMAYILMRFCEKLKLELPPDEFNF